MNNLNLSWPPYHILCCGSRSGQLESRKAKLVRAISAKSQRPPLVEYPILAPALTRISPAQN